MDIDVKVVLILFQMLSWESRLLEWASSRKDSLENTTVYLCNINIFFSCSFHSYTDSGDVFNMDIYIYIGSSQPLRFEKLK